MIKAIFAKIRQNHSLAMVLCCAIPIVGILALSAFGVLGSWAYFLVILICPLAHIFMMRGMHSTPENDKLVSIPDKTDNHG